jgi:hypothetical protein
MSFSPGGIKIPINRLHSMSSPLRLLCGPTFHGKSMPFACTPKWPLSISTTSPSVDRSTGLSCSFAVEASISRRQ